MAFYLKMVKFVQILQFWIKNSHKKVSKKVSRKVSKIQIPEFPSKIVEDVFEALKINPKARLSWLADNLGVSERTIKRGTIKLLDIEGLRKIG